MLCQNNVKLCNAIHTLSGRKSKSLISKSLKVRVWIFTLRKGFKSKIACKVHAILLLMYLLWIIFLLSTEQITNVFLPRDILHTSWQKSIERRTKDSKHGIFYVPTRQEIQIFKLSSKVCLLLKKAVRGFFSFSRKNK